MTTEYETVYNPGKGEYEKRTGNKKSPNNFFRGWLEVMTLDNNFPTTRATPTEKTYHQLIYNGWQRIMIEVLSLKQETIAQLHTISNLYLGNYLSYDSEENRNTKTVVFAKYVGVLARLQGEMQDHAIASAVRWKKINIYTGLETEDAKLDTPIEMLINKLRPPVPKSWKLKR